jgi:hypothetical protein
MLEARMLYCKFVYTIKIKAGRRHILLRLRAINYITLGTFLVTSRTTY